MDVERRGDDERVVALPLRQRTRRQVKADEGGRAGGVDSHRRPLQPERVGDAAGADGRVTAREGVGGGAAPGGLCLETTTSQLSGTNI